MAQRPKQTGADNLVPTGIRSQDRPVRSESLYRLNYPEPHKTRIENEENKYRKKVCNGTKGERKEERGIKCKIIYIQLLCCQANRVGYDSSVAKCSQYTA